MDPKISIIMPVYNGEKYLAEAIKSILCQTISDFELIIVNDKSSDSSKKIAEEYSKNDKRIIVVENKYDKGLPGAINTGLDIAKGSYVARADGDDILKPYRLETQIKYLNKHPEIDIVGGGYKTFGGNTSREIFHPSSSLEIARKFITDTYFCHPTVMFRRSILEKVPHYPQVSCEDFAFFSEIIHEHMGHNIKKIMLDYREHQSNYSSSHKEKISESVYNTFKKNYSYYLGTLLGSEKYFDFKTKRILHFNDIVVIIKTELHIMKKICQKYNIPRLSLQYAISLFNFKKEVIIALLLTIKHGNN